MAQNPTSPPQEDDKPLNRRREDVRAALCAHLLLSLEGGSHGSLLCEFLGVQCFSEGGGLIGVGGYYGSTVGDGVRRSSSVAGRGVQVLPCEQVCAAAC